MQKLSNALLIAAQAPAVEVLPHPFRRQGLAARIAPFALPMVLGYVVALMPPIAGDQPKSPLFMVAAAACAAAIALLIYYLPWERLPRSAESIPPLAAVLFIFLLREGSGQPPHVFAPLLVPPLFWLALYGNGQQLVAAIILLTIASFATRFLHHDGYGPLRFQVLALMICPVICFTTQSLVQRVRWQSQELETLAGTDALTNIPNRRAWDEELPRALARALRLNEMVCVALLDLDNFKQFNDTHGHQAGDTLLQEVVSAWGTTLRTSDFMARYGGEEFAVIFPSCPLHEAVNVLNRVRASMPQSETCSVGVAEWDRHESSVDLLERTDAALYDAKRKGRNRTELSPWPMPSFV